MRIKHPITEITVSTLRGYCWGYRMKLTDRKVKSIKPDSKAKKYADGEGLYLFVSKAGAKVWRMKYRMHGKEDTLVIGNYPEISIAQAREAKAEARALLRQGINPKLQKHTEGKVFADYFYEWNDRRIDTVSAGTHRRTTQRMERNALKIIGHVPVDSITYHEHISRIIKKLEGQGKLYTAKDIVSTISRVFEWLNDENITAINPARGKTRNVKSYQVKHHPHLTAEELPEFLHAVNSYQGYPVARLATLFLLHTFVRTKEMRFATWQEFDIENAVWNIPAERMKMRRKHIVPLSSQVIALLHQIREYKGVHDWVFPSKIAPENPISEVSVLTVINQIGFKGRVDGHGLRGTASTILNERGFNRDHIEKQLAHEDASVRGMYNHAEYLPQRTELMRLWSGMLDACL